MLFIKLLEIPLKKCSKDPILEQKNFSSRSAEYDSFIKLLSPTYSEV